MTLDEIGVKHGTDKGSLCHYYLDFYEKIFSGIEVRDLLEIGIQFGNSARTWHEYFPSAHLTGIDSVDNGPSTRDILDTWICGNAYSKEVVDKLDSYDVIIEDGSHHVADQVFTVRNYPELLTLKGVLIIEDIAGHSVVPQLIEAVPDGFSYAAVDVRPILPNNVLFLVWKR